MNQLQKKSRKNSSRKNLRKSKRQSKKVSNKSNKRQNNRKNLGRKNKTSGGSRKNTRKQLKKRGGELKGYDCTCKPKKITGDMGVGANTIISGLNQTGMSEIKIYNGNEEKELSFRIYDKPESKNNLSFIRVETLNEMSLDMLRSTGNLNKVTIPQLKRDLNIFLFNNNTEEIIDGIYIMLIQADNIKNKYYGILDTIEQKLYYIDNGKKGLVGKYLDFSTLDQTKWVVWILETFDFEGEKISFKNYHDPSVKIDEPYELTQEQRNIRDGTK